MQITQIRYILSLAIVQIQICTTCRFPPGTEYNEYSRQNTDEQENNNYEQ